MGEITEETSGGPAPW